MLHSAILFNGKQEMVFNYLFFSIEMRYLCKSPASLSYVLH